MFGGTRRITPLRQGGRRNALIEEHRALTQPENHNLLLPAFFALAHRALAAAESAARPAAENFFLAFFAGLPASALPCAAILFATPARMLASPWALIFFLAFFSGAGLADGAALIAAHLAF